MIAFGILLEVLAASIGTASKQLIVYSNRHADTRWMFHLGAFMNVAVGPLVDASAYAFAPQIVVAPFASLDVLLNLLLAPYTLQYQQERITRAHILGTALVALGASLTAAFGAVRDDDLTVEALERQLMRKESIVYLGIELALLLAVWSSLRMRRIHPQLRGIALGTMAGVLMGNVFFMKGLVCLVREAFVTGSLAAFLRPTPYIVVLAAVGGAVLGHMVMRKGLEEYKGVFMVTIFEGAHITTACLSGCVVMSELSGEPWWRFICYWSSVALIVGGILLVNRAAESSSAGADLRQVTPIDVETPPPPTTPPPPDDRAPSPAGDRLPTRDFVPGAMTPTPRLPRCFSRGSGQHSQKGTSLPSLSGNSSLSEPGSLACALNT